MFNKIFNLQNKKEYNICYWNLLESPRKNFLLLIVKIFCKNKMITTDNSNNNKMLNMNILNANIMLLLGQQYSVGYLCKGEIGLDQKWWQYNEFVILDLNFNLRSHRIYKWMIINRFSYIGPSTCLFICWEEVSYYGLVRCSKWVYCWKPLQVGVHPMAMIEGQLSEMIRFKMYINSEIMVIRCKKKLEHLGKDN